MKKFLHKYMILLGTTFLAILLILDQWTKALAVTHLKGKAPFVLWEGVFEFYYYENTGAAWGMLKDKQIFFYILTTVFCAVILYEIWKIRKLPRFTPFAYTLFLVLAGALGNFIDRLRLKYVVDFIYVKLIDFPIFNLADCYITVSVVILLLLMLFFYSDEEFDALMPRFLAAKAPKKSDSEEKIDEMPAE